MFPIAVDTSIASMGMAFGLHVMKGCVVIWTTLVPGLARGGELLLRPRENREGGLVGCVCGWCVIG